MIGWFFLSGKKIVRYLKYTTNDDLLPRLFEPGSVLKEDKVRLRQFVFTLFVVMYPFFLCVKVLAGSQAIVLPKKSISVSGLPNVGGSCYMNASLQCLFRIPEFACFIESAKKDKKESPLLWRCKQLVGIVADRREIEVVWAAATELFQCMNKQLFNKFDDQQEDAFDFFVRLIDRVQLFQHLFRFSINTTIYCTQCNNVLRSANQIMYDLPLNAFQPQIINNICCSYCCCFDAKAKKEVTLNSYPPYLLVDCEPMYGASKSIIADDFYSEQLSFFGYDLIGIVLHAGTKLTGHFIAYVKDVLSGQWYLCDDMYVLKQGNLTRKWFKQFLFVPRFFLYKKIQP